MTRTLFYACVLMAVAALATVWALAPGCEGSFCLGGGYKAGAERDRARVADVPDAGRGLLGKTAQELAPAASSRVSIGDSQASWSEPEPHEEPDEAPFALEPEIAPEDWQDRQTVLAGRATGDTSADGSIGTFGERELTPVQRRARQAAEVTAAKEWDTLEEAALKEPDDELRGEAINGVASHRSVESVAVLTEVAAFDPAPDNRLQAVQQLWYSAADGLDSDGGIESTLRAALDDPDEAIAKMAEKALADLETLDEARALD